MTETKPNPARLADLERDAAGGGLPPMAAPALTSDEPSDRAIAGGDDTESSDSSEVKKAARDLLDKYGSELLKLCSQSVIDELTAIADGDDGAAVRESLRCKVLGERPAPTSRRLAEFVKQLR